MTPEPPPQPELLTCPPAATLRQHLLGELHGPAADAIDRHFTACEACLTFAEKVEATDDFTDAIKAATPIPRDQQTAISGLMETVRHLISKESQGSAKTPDAVPLASPTPAISVEETACGGSPPRELLTLPFVLGHYELQEHIGTGGMGSVYRATDVRLHRQVAVKVLHAQGDRPNEFRRRLLREAQSAAAIEHPNVASVLDVGEVDGIPFLVMPLLRGESMQSRLNKVGALPTEEVIRMGREIAAGLMAAHEAGLVHRDLKPENIWLDETTDRVRILDFGLARSIEEDSTLTQEGVIVGTPLFMAPEQALGGKVDARTDLFGLGGVLYLAATGKPAFFGRNALHTTVSVLTTEPEDAKRVNPDVSSALSSLIAKLLRKDAADRFQSSGELATALAKLQIAPRKREIARWPPGRLLLAIASCVVVFGITIVIRNKDGSETRIEVPDSASSVEIEGHGVKRTIKLAGGTTFSSDREIATWIIENGGSVSVRTGDTGRPRSVTETATLPADIQIVEVQLSGNTGFKPEAIKQLDGLEHLESVSLNNMELDEDVFQHLTASPRLAEIRLQYGRFSATAARSLPSLPHLRALHLYRTETEPEAMLHVAKIERLNSLILAGAFSDAHIEMLGRLPEVLTLSIESGSLTDAGMQIIGQYPQLDFLALRGCLRLTDESMRFLGSCGTLTRLNLKGARISDRGIEHLDSLPRLSSLSLQLTETTATCVTSLRQHKTLTELGLRGPNIDHDFVAQAATLPALKQLNVHSDGITDETLAMIRQTGLTALVLESNSISNDAAQKLVEANPGCQIQIIGPQK